MAMGELKHTILQVLPALQTGGVERTTVDIAAAVVEGGGRALVASAGGRMVAELDAVGAEHVALPLSTKSPVGIWRNAGRLADVIEREGVGLVHARSRAPAWSALWAARRTGRPFVTTFHGIYTEKTPPKALYNSVMARGDAVIANSHFTADVIARRYPFAAGKIVPIARGIDIDAMTADASERVPALLARFGIEAGVPVILHLARLTALKGHEVVIDALHILKETLSTPFVCVMAGDDHGREAFRKGLEAKAAGLGLENEARFVGHVSDVAGALAASTVAIQPSIVPESFGRAAVEAQAAAVPVVVSDLGAVSETVLAPPAVAHEERTGFRVRANDAGALAGALATLLEAPEDERRAMGERGRAHASAHFSITSMQMKTLRVYRSLLE